MIARLSRPICLVLWATFLGVPLGAQAAPIAYDGFEGYTTEAALGGNSGGTAWATDWVSIPEVIVQAPTTGLSYSNGAVVVNGGSQAILNANGSPAASRTFAAQSDTVYFSLLFRADAGIDSDDFLQFALNNDTNIENSGSIGDVNTGSSGNTFGARIGAGNGGTSASLATQYDASTTYFLVGKMSKVASTNFNRMDLYVNPSTLTEPVTSSIFGTGNAGFGSFSHFTLRVVNLNGGDIYYFDELRIGTTWESVVIPEPNGASLIWAALVGLGFARRRVRPR